MHTDYIGGEERCRVIARKLIYCIAAICCTGGAADALGMPEIVRAKAMTGQFTARPAAAAPKLERVAMHATDIAAEPNQTGSIVADEPAAEAARSLHHFRLCPPFRPYRARRLRRLRRSGSRMPTRALKPRRRRWR